MMPLQNDFTICWRGLRRNDGTDQILQIRLGYVNRLISRSPSRLISRSPSAGLPYDILETSSTQMQIARFPLPLQELEDPLFCEAYVVQQLYTSFNLGVDLVNCKAIAQKITPSVVQMAAENYDEKFQLVADIDYIQMFWQIELEQRSNNVVRGVMVEETVILEEVSMPAATVIERMNKKKQIFDGLPKREELGECIVCCDELNGQEKMVARIPCRHVFHKSCILT